MPVQAAARAEHDFCQFEEPYRDHRGDVVDEVPGNGDNE